MLEVEVKRWREESIIILIKMTTTINTNTSTSTNSKLRPIEGRRLAQKNE
jgi:hypothetical protein